MFVKVITNGAQAKNKLTREIIQVATLNQIKHVIPQVGPIELKLYDPADALYKVLKDNKEINRLSKLRHLGALSFALEGARLARWDYTVALLHYSSQMTIPRFNSKFTLGKVKFSSSIAALQVASLAWNIGHLPGTFAVEKGVYRYLASRSSIYPASSLHWKFRDTDEVKHIIRKSNELLIEADFYALSKILAVIKLLSFCETSEEFLFNLTVDFIAPLFLDYEVTHSKQWAKIRESFKLVRHVSYLTMDSPFCGDSWLPNIPVFFDSQKASLGKDLYTLSSKISESLSPIEINIYEKLYHCEIARIETAIYAEHIYKSLHKTQTPIDKISQWMTSGLTRELNVGKRLNHSQVNILNTLHLRTHFCSLPMSIVKTERELINKDFSHSSVHKYHSWNSDTLLEPDKYTIDFIKKGGYTSRDIGRLLVWIIDTFDIFGCETDDFVSITRKLDLEESYKSILTKALEFEFPDFEIKYDAWPLNEFGLFPSIPLTDTKGAVWASTGKMEDKVIRHLLLNRLNKIEQHHKSLYTELLGLKELRRYYRSSLNPGVHPRCRWLIFSSSITLNKLGQPSLEFDGGALKISVRSGNMTWYGLETKSGNENPASSLRRKARKNGIKANVHSINSSHAYIEIPIKTD